MGKDLVHQCTRTSTSLLLLQKMPAVSQHADVRYTNSHSDPEMLPFCALHFTLYLATLLLQEILCAYGGSCRINDLELKMSKSRK